MYQYWIFFQFNISISPKKGPKKGVNKSGSKLYALWLTTSIQKKHVKKQHKKQGDDVMILLIKCEKRLNFPEDWSQRYFLIPQPSFSIVFRSNFSLEW